MQVRVRMPEVEYVIRAGSTVRLRNLDPGGPSYKDVKLKEDVRFRPDEVVYDPARIDGEEPPRGYGGHYFFTLLKKQYANNPFDQMVVRFDEVEKEIIN